MATSSTCRSRSKSCSSAITSPTPWPGSPPRPLPAPAVRPGAPAVLGGEEGVVPGQARDGPWPFLKPAVVGELRVEDAWLGGEGNFEFLLIPVGLRGRHPFPGEQAGRDGRRFRLRFGAGEDAVVQGLLPV